MRFYGVVFTNVGSGLRTRKQQVFRDRSTASRFFDRARDSLDRGEQVTLYARENGNAKATVFSEALETALTTNSWDENWLIEGKYEADHPAEFNTDVLLDNLAGQLTGVLKLAYLGNIDARTLLDKALEKDRDLREAFGPALIA